MNKREECGVKVAFFSHRRNCSVLCAIGKDPVKRKKMMIQKRGEKF